MAVSFMHFRKFNNGQMQPKGGMTVAIAATDTRINFAISECSEHDVFNKKIGRGISEGRLNAMRAGKPVKMTYTIAPGAAPDDQETSAKSLVCAALVDMGILDTK